MRSWMKSKKLRSKMYETATFYIKKKAWLWTMKIPTHKGEPRKKMEYRSHMGGYTSIKIPGRLRDARP
jgi:hypothetical protein